MTDTTSPKDGEAHPAALAALQYLNALGFQEKQDFLLTFSSLAIEGNRLAECYGLAWEINRMKTTQAVLDGLAAVDDHGVPDDESSRV